MRSISGSGDLRGRGRGTPTCQDLPIFWVSGQASQIGLASTSLLGSCPSGQRSSNEAAGVSQQAVFVCDRFKYALKHVSVLYEFSTLIEPEECQCQPMARRPGDS